MINVLILLAGLAILGLSLAFGIILPLGRATQGRTGAPVPTTHILKGIVGAVIGALILVAGASAPFVEVPAGNVGVVTNFGSVQSGTLEPGLHIVIPIVQHVAIIDTRVQPHQFQEIDAASAEYQTVKLTGVMNYHVDGQFASDLYQRVGTDFASKVIDPAFNDFIKTVVPAYKVDQILGARDEIRSKAKDALAANLAQYHIIVDDIYIANISFSDAFQQAIEAKQVAQQQVQTETPDPRPEEDPGRPGRGPGAGPGRLERQAGRGPGRRDHRPRRGSGDRQQVPGGVPVGPDPPVPVHPEADRQDHGDARPVRQRVDLRSQGPAEPGHSLGVAHPLTRDRRRFAPGYPCRPERWPSG